MKNKYKNCSKIIQLLLMAALILICTVTSADESKDVIDSDTIVDGLLNGEGDTRGISVKPRVVKSQQPENTQQKPSKAQLETIPTASVAKPTKVKPAQEVAPTKPAKTEVTPLPSTISLSIRFQFGSAGLTPQAETQLIELGKALTSSQLSAYSFEIGGHTDSVGKSTYNKWLSEQRAVAVKQYLTNNFALNQQKLFARGYGEEQPLLQNDPANGANRRVEIRAFAN